ncbi:MAG: hypothetical protein JWL72_265 [Ilumatobacteraceae bacterium]|nr:hypothetical protein [Ilumatobacteraceae bacterium]
MRATCEHCDQPQPVDWQPGDLCVNCGRAARHDVRCSWCSRWTPAAKYCRECGAETVDEWLYGAARMLQHAGVDQFTIPTRLASLDPAQIDNFTRIYQRHAIVAARHAEQLTFLQRFLCQTGWAAELDDRLAAQIPWPDDELRRLSTTPVDLLDSSPAERIETARGIQESTPFDTTRALAAIARVRLDDWAALDDAVAAVSDADTTVQVEAALAVTSWRVLTGAIWFDGDGSAAIDVLRGLATTPFAIDAQIRLALLRDDEIEIAPGAFDSADHERSVGAALVVGDVDRLAAALHGDPIARAAAGAALARLGVTRPLGPVLHEGPDDVRATILRGLTQTGQPVPELTAVLVDIATSSTSSTDIVRQMAARVAAATMSPTDAIRVVRVALATDDRRIIQSLLQRTRLQPDDLGALVDEVIADGTFTAQQFGMTTIAEDARLSDAFVPTRFPHAMLPTQIELLALAETQLGARGDAELHRFVMGVVFGPGPTELRTAAWWVLHRWYRRQGDARGEGPFRLELGIVTDFFETIEAFVPRLAVVARDAAALDEVAFCDFAAALFGSADDAFVEAVQSMDRVGGDLVDALIDGIGQDRRINTLESMMELLSRLAAREAWCERALTALERVDRTGNHRYDQSVRRLRLAAGQATPGSN